MFASAIPRGVLSRPASESGARAREVQTDATFMKMELERLFMITESLWRFMRDKHGYSDADLEQMIQDVDLQDGKLDGKVTKTPGQCGRCQRALLRAKPLCIYCGEPTTGQTFVR